MKERVVSRIFSKVKEWEKRGGVLLYKSDGHGGLIAAPVAINARSFEIEITFKRLSGTRQVRLGRMCRLTRARSIFVTTRETRKK